MTVSAPTRLLRGAALVLGALALWAFADLYFRVDLPGAGPLLHGSFRAVTDVFQWFDIDRSRLDRLVWIGPVLLGLAVVLPRRGAPLQRLLVPLFCGPLLVALVVAALLERGIFAGWVVGSLLLWRRGLLFGPLRAEGWRSSVVAGGIGVTLGLGALAYLFLLISADSSGYELPARLQALDRAGGLGARGAFILLLGALGIASLARVRKDASAVLLAGGAAALVAALGSTGGTRATSVGTAVAVVLITAALGPPILGAVASDRWEMRRWPGAMLLPGLVAGVLFCHTYTARLFHCPDVFPQYLTRIADPAEVFSTAIGPAGDLALSLREERRIGRVRAPYGPGPHVLESADPGPIPAPPPQEGVAPGTTYATVEELVSAPGADAFFATALAGHTDFYSLPTSPPSTVNNMVVRVRGDGSAAVDAFWQEHLCWIGTLSWDAAADRLYMGCEYEPQIHRLDFGSKTIDLAATDARLGDVAGIAVDPVKDRLYTVSLWDSDRVTELDRSTLEVLRSRRIGGTHYALAFDPDRGHLFAPAFYSSRIRIVDTSDLAVVGSIRTGLGPRALNFVPGDEPLLLAAAVYDDVLRVCDGQSGIVRASVRVGGHVKSIAVDRERRLAYFWSRCGLFRLDLDAALAAQE